MDEQNVRMSLAVIGVMALFLGLMSLVLAMHSVHARIVLMMILFPLAPAPLVFAVKRDYMPSVDPEPLRDPTPSAVFWAVTAVLLASSALGFLLDVPVIGVMCYTFAWLSGGVAYARRRVGTRARARTPEADEATR